MSILITFMAAKELNCMDKMSVERGSPSHSRCSHASLASTEKSLPSLELSTSRLWMVQLLMIMVD